MGRRAGTASAQSRRPDQNDLPAVSPHALKLSGALLRYADQLVREDGRVLYVVEVPRRNNRTSFQSTLEMLPKADLALVNAVSPVQAFREVASPNVKLYYEHGHWHLTPTAVNALVEVVAPQLEKSAKLLRCRPASR